MTLSLPRPSWRLGWLPALLLLLAVPASAQTGVFISQYVETNSGSTPKGIEIYNGTGSAINLANSPITIIQRTNANPPGVLVTINTGTFGAGEVIVVGTSDIGEYLTSVSSTARYIDFGFSFNGDDALQIQLDGVTQDTFGELNTRPSGSWSGNGVSSANQNISIRTDIAPSGNPSGFTDPSTRFVTTSTTPASPGGLSGFGTAPSFGDDAPTVASIQPEDNATDVPVGANVEITFSERVFASDNAFSLSCDEAPVPFSVQRDPQNQARRGEGFQAATVYVLTPDSDLPSGASCTVGITASLVSDEDTDDNNNNDNLAEDFSSAFTVELLDDAPFVERVLPADNAENVLRDRNVIIDFSERVFANGGAFRIECSRSGVVPFSLRRSGGNDTEANLGDAEALLGGDPSATRFTLDPDSDFLFGDVCTVTVRADRVSDADRDDPPDNMDADFVSTFTVEAGPTVSFAVVQSTVGENTGTYNLTLVLGERLEAPATVTVALVQGDAADIDGFETTTLSLTAGPDSPLIYTIPITITADGLVEPDESVVFEITSASGNGPEGLRIIDPSTSALLILDVISTVPGDNALAWINEFHYDNGGTDENEFVEIAVDTAALAGSTAGIGGGGGSTVADLTLTLYNGNGGLAYGTFGGADWVQGATVGDITLYSIETPGLQNGSPDGFSLDLNGTLLQFLSYEGAFEAADGPASGITSTDVGVFEASSTTATQSLSLQGDGMRAGDFTWAAGTTATPGQPNIGQTFGDGGPGGAVAIAVARAAGVGATVTVEGTVSRAAGAFTYFQDETAGLVIRQTSGEFFEAVADGTIAPGTTLTVTGTLSEFGSLLQINGAGLTDYEVTGTADVPDPQTITLEELVTNGENYESELIEITGLTIAATGLFEARTSYTLSDGTETDGFETLRIPNADDTTVDGTAIPEIRADIIGVGGQFNFDDPMAGYQILAIDAADVTQAANVATGDDPETSLTLRVANPIRSASTVSFSLPTAGLARVDLYDALGRRVAVIAEGDMSAGDKTATLDAAALAAGVYVLRLQAGADVVTRTLTVVR